jgi:putative transposase
MRGPKPAVVALNAQEQSVLEELVGRHSTPQQIAMRGRMIRAAAQGKNNAHIGRELGVKAETVRSWRMRWIG